MATTTDGWIPVLHVADAEASCNHYCQKLGFSKDWEHQFEPGFPKFVSISQGSLKLFLSEHQGDGCRQARIYLYVPDVDKYHKQIESQGMTVPAPVDQPYGTREIEIVDLDGHRIKIGTILR